MFHSLQGITRHHGVTTRLDFWLSYVMIFGILGRRLVNEHDIRTGCYIIFMSSMFR